jgi:hypothetical protein
LLARDFKVTALDQRWVTDITFLRTRQGWLYLAIIAGIWPWPRSIGRSSKATEGGALQRPPSSVGHRLLQPDRV